MLAIHKVHEDVLHLFNVWVRRLHCCLLEALTPPIVAVLRFFRVASYEFKISNLDHNLVLFAIRG